MARTLELKCDICKRSCKKIVAKINYIPMIPGVSRGVHSNYSHHADVGECCGTKILRVFNFRERMSAAEYQESRRAS